MGIRVYLQLKVGTKRYFEDVKDACLNNLTGLAEKAELEEIASWADLYEFNKEKNTIALEASASTFDDEACFKWYFQQVANAVPKANFSGNLAVSYKHMSSDIDYVIKKQGESFYYGRPPKKEQPGDLISQLQTALEEEFPNEDAIDAVFSVLSEELNTMAYDIEEVCSLDVEDAWELEDLLAVQPTYENMAKVLKLFCERNAGRKKPIKYALEFFGELCDIAGIE
jgi:hypothetical protein